MIQSKATAAFLSTLSLTVLPAVFGFHNSAAQTTEPAARAPMVRVVAPDCGAAPLAFNAFVDSLRVELAARGPDCCEVDPTGAQTPSGGDLALTIQPCDPSTEQVGVTVVAAGGRLIRRQLSFADVLPASRPRALALAVAELIRSLGQPPAPATPPPAAAPPPVAVQPSAAARIRFGVSAGAELRLHPRYDTTLWGGAVTIMSALDRWQAALDLHGGTGSQSFALGDVGVSLLGAGVSAGPRFSAGAADVALGLGGEVGWAWIDGRSTQPAVVTRDGSGLVATVGARVAVEVPASRSPQSWRLRALVAAGSVVRPVTAQIIGAPAAGISGSYFLLGLGGAFTR